MPRYKLKARSFINNTVQDEGAIVEYDGLPGSNLEALDVATVPVPKDWRTRKPASKLIVAKSLGFDVADPTSAEVTKFIEDKLAEREAAQAPRPPLVPQALGQQAQDEFRDQQRPPAAAPSVTAAPRARVRNKDRG